MLRSIKTLVLICSWMLWQRSECFQIEINNDAIVELRNAIMDRVLRYDSINDFIKNTEGVKFGEDAPVICFAVEAEDDVPRVTVPSLGTARGKVMTTLLGKEFYAFHSIRYGVPPFDNLRFQMTTLWEDEWDSDFNGIEGDYDATYLRAKCPQSSYVSSIPGGREDCLFISIYTQKDVIENPDRKYPVMFFIHGGGFIGGDASTYIPTKLMDQDVIVVTVQYRLGTLGFLAALTPDNPGNMGLMDQVLALRWVQKYISYFGGDPDSVTVFGQSAGGTSTSWLQFTNTTTADGNDGTPLLHRAIVHSGSALEVWAQDPDPHGSFVKEAVEVDCWDDGDSESAVDDALECMRNKPVQDIVRGFLNVCNNDMKNGGLGFLGVSPVIQTELLENYPDEVESNPDLLFLRDEPLTLIDQGHFMHIPLMMGSVRDEGSLVLGLVYYDFLVPNKYENDELFLKYKFLPIYVDAFGIEDTTGAVSNSFKLTFLKFAEMGNWDSMSGGLVDLSGMLFLKTGLWTLTQLLTYKNPDNPVFFYSFEFESDDSLFDWFFPSDVPIEGGVTHADELQYLFAMPGFQDERERNLVSKFTKLWFNFASCGNPTPDDDCGLTWEDIEDKWEPFDFRSSSYMLIQDEFRMESDFTFRWNHNTIPDPDCNTNYTYRF